MASVVCGEGEEKEAHLRSPRSGLMQCGNLCLATEKTFQWMRPPGWGLGGWADIERVGTGWRGGCNGAVCDYMHRGGAGMMNVARVSNPVPRRR